MSAALDVSAGDMNNDLSERELNMHPVSTLPSPAIRTASDLG